MVDCPTEEDIVSFTKDELEDTNCIHISNHLDTCSGCANKLDSLQKHLRLYEHFQTPQFLVTNNDWLALKEKLEVPENKVTSTKKSYRNIYALAASVLFSCSIFYVYFFMYTVNHFTISRGIVLNENAQKIDTQYSKIQHIKNTYLQTPDFATAQLLINNNVTCSLDFSSKISLTSVNEVDLEEGNFFFEVVPGTFFRIKTKYGIIQVLGTQFLVNHKNEKLEVSVYDGIVKFIQNDSEVLVPSGKSLFVDNMEIKKEDLDIHTKPKWVDMPLSLELKTNNGFIIIQLTNLTSDEIRLPLFSGSTPHLLFHIKQDDNPFETPVFSSNKNVTILPGETIDFNINKENIVKSPGLYEVAVTFQGKIQKQKLWSGIIRSSTIKIYQE